MYEIIINSKKSYMDENIKIVIKGMPQELLTLCVETHDYYNSNGDLRIMEVGTRWETEQDVILDDEGICTFDAKVFTRMKIVDSKNSALLQELSEIPTNQSAHYTFTLEKDHHVVASIVHERMFCDESVIHQDITSEQLVARYFIKEELLEKAGEVPAIIVVSGSDGRIERAQAFAECFARRGMAALAVCYFGMAHTPADLNRVPLEYIEEAICWLKRRKEVDISNINAYGRSKGGEMILLSASLFPEFKKVVANTPSIYVNQGLKTSGGIANHSSWCYHGKEMPYVKATFLPSMRLLCDFAKKDCFALRNYTIRITWNRKNHSEALIPMKNSHADFLFLSSDSDAIWPSDLYAKEAETYFKEQGREACIQSHCYHGSGHMLTIPFQPIPNCEEYGGTLELGIDATIDAWSRTIRHLTR